MSAATKRRGQPLVGRVLRIDAAALTVWAETQVQTLPLPPAPSALRPGDLVAIDGASCTLLARPDATIDDVFDRDGDLGRLIADGGLRARALHERAAALQAVRRFFDRRGFVEAETPAIATSPGLELHLDPVAVALREGMAGAPVQRFLVTSPEYHCKRLLHAGVPRLYVLGRAFRSGERGAWHNPEFTMLEWYRAGAEAADILRDIRGLASVVASALAHARGDGAAAAPAPLGRPLRLSFLQALERWAGVRCADAAGRCLPQPALRAELGRVGLEVRAEDDEAAMLLHAFAERVEPALRHHAWVEIAPWPASLASLARPLPDRPWLADRFEVYLHGVEVANGFGELTDAVEQRRRFEADLRERVARGLPQPPIDERFLQALERGCPPAAGVALGVDRLLMVLGGYTDIEQVLAFPFERA